MTTEKQKYYIKSKNFQEIIYLATPYLHKNANVMDLRADVSDIIAAELINGGDHVYAPISSWHHVAKKYGLPRDWKYWYKLDENFLNACGKLLVIILQGWKESNGVTAEIELAKQFNLDIAYVDPTIYVDMLRKEDKYTRYMYDTYGKVEY